MTDYYSLEKIAQSYRIEAEKTAAQDRLAAQATAAARKNRRAGRAAGHGIAARLRALAFASVRRLDTAAERNDG
jgi:hypothetical protein